MWIAFCLIIYIGSSNAYFNPNYTTAYIKQKVDQFSFANSDTFLQRYLYSTEHWNSNGGPIFLYTGNEGDITLFAYNTGFMWDIAPDFKAMVVFAEHRYYGKSLPYGKKSFSAPEYSGYLTSQQALADYADLVVHLKSSFKGAEESPVIAFGGSYGGMLAAWFRMKYPHIVQGAISSSAPVWQFINMTPCNVFGELVTRDFNSTNPACVEVIRKSWKAIDDITKTAEGLAWLSSNWKLCKSLVTKDDVWALKDYLTNVWTNLAMADYPYPANFLANLPAHPVTVVCQKMKVANATGKDVLNQIFEGLSVYFNYTSTASCLNYHQQATSLLDDEGWDFQACSEMVMPFCYSGKADFFEPMPWNFTQYSLNCYKKWKVMPRPVWVQTDYGGKNMLAASNIVFSNGLLDPWSVGGVLKNLSSTLVAVVIPEGAHHLDLRQSDPNDPPSVISAREFEKKWIRMWIEEFTAK